jgi:O-antigen ligase
MVNRILEKRLAFVLAWGTLAVTLIITDRVSSEPANLGKMLLLSTIALSILPLIFNNLKSLYREHRSLIASCLFFLVALLFSIFASESTFERGIYGAFGRNTGLLTYFLLALIFLGSASLTESASFRKIEKALIVAGVVNIIYCIFASQGYDLFTWQNPNNAVMGTFGNSNFIGAFMGIFIGVLGVKFISTLKDIYKSILYISMIALALYVIDLSNALQGFLVAGFTVILVMFFYLRSITKNVIILIGYVSAFSMSALLALLGILNKGPLANFLYKPSVTFRGEYWMAGINMGLDNPTLGVGIDSYGLYYRTYRNESASIYPGVDTTTDAAHNVFIDVFSGSGLIGLFFYLAFTFFILKSSLSYLKQNKEFNPLFLSLFIPWCGYQLQSIVSINQIGLAVWNWLLGGAIVGYISAQKKPSSDKANQGKVSDTKRRSSQSNPSDLLPAGKLLTMIIAASLGFLMALPPFIADVNYRKIMKGDGNSETLINLAMKFPLDANRINRSVVVLANSGLSNAAISLAEFGSEKFPNDYASWYSLYELSEVGSVQREKYRRILNQIDPYNAKYFSQ